MDIPAPIDEFFRMKNAEDNMGLADLFTKDATVVDGGEGKTMQGPEAIKEWIANSLSGLSLYTEIQQIQKIDEDWVIDTHMTGSFAASPAHFKYTFRLNGAKITRLQIDFLGTLK
jgi:hypothetical protein